MAYVVGIICCPATTRGCSVINYLLQPFADPASALSRTCLQLLEEYFDSLDISEASRCLSRLSVPFFHHELVKQAVHKGMEQPNQVDHVINLLKKMSDSNEVNSSQLLRGFQRVANNLPDTTLDNPAAHVSIIMQ